MLVADRDDFSNQNNKLVNEGEMEREIKEGREREKGRGENERWGEGVKERVFDDHQRAIEAMALLQSLLESRRDSILFMIQKEVLAPISFYSLPFWKILCAP